MINTATLARTHPVLIIVEDAQWIDAVSESLLADFLSVIPCTPSMVLITARSEYQGALARVPGAQTVTLATLSDPDIAMLIAEMLGSDPSLGKLPAKRHREARSVSRGYQLFGLVPVHRSLEEIFMDLVEGGER